MAWWRATKRRSRPCARPVSGKRHSIPARARRLKACTCAMTSCLASPPANRAAASPRWSRRTRSRERVHDHPDRRYVAIEAASRHGAQRACVRLALEPEDTVVIGDTVFDMEMARNAGASAIGVSWGYHPVADLRMPVKARLRCSMILRRARCRTGGVMAHGGERQDGCRPCVNSSKRFSSISRSTRWCRQGRARAPSLRKRFYKQAQVGRKMQEKGFPALARRQAGDDAGAPSALVAPVRDSADAIAQGMGSAGRGHRPLLPCR